VKYEELYKVYTKMFHMNPGLWTPQRVKELFVYAYGTLGLHPSIVCQHLFNFSCNDDRMIRELRPFL